MLKKLWAIVPIVLGIAMSPVAAGADASQSKASIGFIKETVPPGKSRDFNKNETIQSSDDEIQSSTETKSSIEAPPSNNNSIPNDNQMSTNQVNKKSFFPNTGEKQSIYLSLIGILVIVLFYIWKRLKNKKIQKIK